MVRINLVLAHLVALAFVRLALLVFLFSMTITSVTTLTCQESLSKDEVITCQLLNHNFPGIKSEQKLLLSNFTKAAIVRKFAKKANLEIRVYASVDIH